MLVDLALLFVSPFDDRTPNKRPSTTKVPIGGSSGSIIMTRQNWSVSKVRQGESMVAGTPIAANKVLMLLLLCADQQKRKVSGKRREFVAQTDLLTREGVRKRMRPRGRGTLNVARRSNRVRDDTVEWAGMCLDCWLALCCGRLFQARHTTTIGDGDPSFLTHRAAGSTYQRPTV